MFISFVESSNYAPCTTQYGKTCKQENKGKDCTWQFLGHGTKPIIATRAPKEKRATY